MPERLGDGDVVDGDELDVGAGGLGGPEDITADAAEAVDPYADGHVEELLWLLG